MIHLPLGPLMIDVAGLALSDLDRQQLCNPLVGGVILFSYNYADPTQLEALTSEIHALRQPPLLIAVDHEGGRVQRFREGFTRLPSMATLGKCHDENPAAALASACDVGYVLAAELRARGIDYSFTPVLDLDYGPSRVIGDRALHRQADVVIALANALGEGLREGGMGTCGKHFPGHGFVIPDSHLELPVDHRPLHEMQDDIQPYRQVALDGVMAAHVIYDCVDCSTAVFSNKWINYLRNDINFNGVVFTDDLSMEGAGVVGNMVNRVDTAYRAGCDMMVVSHAPEGVALVLKEWQPALQDEHRQRVEALIPKKALLDWAQLQAEPRYQAAVQHIASLVA